MVYIAINVTSIYTVFYIQYYVNTETLGDTLSHIAIQFKGLEVELWNSIITILRWYIVLYFRCCKFENGFDQRLVYMCFLAIVIFPTRMIMKLKKIILIGL